MKDKIQKAGFTLIELSIVLIIIGLLIGGILVGQSLMDSARVNKEARKISQWTIAINNFKNKFKQYPGDSSYFLPAGNNDGNMNDNEVSPEEDDVFYCPNPNARLETLTAWSHLTQSQMLSGEKYVWSSANYCASPQILKGMYPLSDVEYYGGGILDVAFYANKTKPFSGNEYLIMNYYKFYDLLALEKKLDDGVPAQNGGSIYSQLADSGGICNIAGAEAEKTNLNLSSTNDVICWVHFYFNEPISPN